MAAGEMLHEKKQATPRSAIGTDLLVSRGECETAGQRALDCFPLSSDHGETGGMKWYRYGAPAAAAAAEG